jgi:hypothetical protein
MTEDAGTAQARALLVELWLQVSDISTRLEAAEARNRRAQLRGTSRRDPIASSLRRELYQVHRLIDGLHQRYPDTQPAPDAARTG